LHIKKIQPQNENKYSGYLTYDYGSFPFFFLAVNQSQEYSGRRRVNYQELEDGNVRVNIRG